MKKKLTAALFALLSAPVMGMAMDSDTLLASPNRYRPIFADEEQVIYADMHTVRAMQSRDYPGSIENISVTLYVESYVQDPDAMDFEEGSLVRGITEYAAQVHGNKAEGVYSMNANLTAAYDSAGKPADMAAANRIEADADDLYYTLVRVSRLR